MFHYHLERIGYTSGHPSEVEIFNPNDFPMLTFRLNNEFVIRVYTHEPKLEVLFGKGMNVQDALSNIKKFQPPLFTRPAENKSESVEDELWGS